MQNVSRNSAVMSRPRRRTRQTLPSGAQLVLKHIEAAEKEYDEIYGDDWGAKTGKPVYSERQRRAAVKDAHETIFGDIERAFEFLAAEDRASRVFAIVCKDALGLIPGGDALTEKQVSTVTKQAEASLVNFLSSPLLQFCTPRAMADNVGLAATVLKNRLANLSRGFGADGSRGKKLPKFSKWQDQLEVCVWNLHDCLQHQNSWDHLSPELATEIVDLLREISPKIEKEELKKVVDVAIQCDLAFVEKQDEDEDDEEEEEEDSFEDDDEEDFDVDEFDDNEEDGSDDEEYEQNVDDVDEEEEEREMERRAREEEEALDEEVVTDNGTDQEQEEEEEEDDDSDED